MKRYLIILMAMLGVQMTFAQPWEADNEVFNPSGIPSLTFSQPRFADLDGDGDYDFLLGNTNAAPIYIENTGTVGVPSFAVGTGLTAGVSSLDAEMGVCADMDADGDFDLVTGGFTGLHLFQNTGTSTAPVFSEVAGYFSGLAVGSNPVPDLADLDNDGDADLVVGLSEDGSVLLYTNTGSPANGQFSQSAMQVLGDVGLYAYPVFCDLDSDNDQDILVGRDSHGFIYYQNTGSPSVAIWQTNSALFSGLGMTDYWNSPDLVDLNNDGLYDLIFGTASGPLQYYVNTGTAALPVWQANISLFGGVLDAGGASSPIFFDFDDDGDLDLISGSQLGNIKYYANTGSLHAPGWDENSALFAVIDHSIYAAVAIGDVNGDNLPDAIIGDLSGNLYFHRNNGMTFVQEAGVLPAATFGGWSVPRLLDMDNDGDLDLVVGNEAGNMRYFNNQGTVSTPNWVESAGYFGTIDVGSNCVPSFGDVDNDGDLDLVAGNLSGDLRCYLKQGFGWTQNTALFAGISTDQNAAPALVDLDADGDLDLALGDYDGTFKYWRNLLYSGTLLNPPQNLSVTISGDVILTWDAPAEGSTSPFMCYKLNVNNVILGTTTNQSWHFDIIPEGMTCTAAVTAIYSAGESTPATVSWTMPIHYPPLDPAYQLFFDHIHISWSAPLPGTYPVQYYRFYVDSALYSETQALSADISAPQNGHTYNVQITALYSDGVESTPALLDVLYTPNSDDLNPPDCSTALQGNYPNPFNPETTIWFQIKDPAKAELVIYNLQGQVIRTLVKAELTAGTHSALWNGRDETGQSVASGVYLCRLSTGKSVQTRKMVLMK